MSVKLFIIFCGQTLLFIHFQKYELIKENITINLVFTRNSKSLCQTFFEKVHMQNVTREVQLDVCVLVSVTILCIMCINKLCASLQIKVPRSFYPRLGVGHIGLMK